jgi:hypothetical protein
MIYRGPGFLAVVLIRLFALALPLSPVSKLSLFLSLQMFRRPSLLTGEGRRGAKSYDHYKALPSTNHSIFSVDCYYPAKSPPPPHACVA